MLAYFLQKEQLYCFIVLQISFFPPRLLHVACGILVSDQGSGTHTPSLEAWITGPSRKSQQICLTNSLIEDSWILVPAFVFSDILLSFEV